MRDLMAAARGGASGVLVLRGGPGIGKTALLDHAAQAAADAGMRVLRARGVEHEAELPFAGLHLLLGGAVDRLAALPAPQRRALEGAFGLAAAPEPGDRLLVGLGVLSLLAELAEERPLACLVDDAQWLDRASAEALALAARRLAAEPVALLLAGRDEHAGFLGLPVLEVGPLDEPEAAALLTGTRPCLSSGERRQVLATAAGNPLALAELRPRGPEFTGPGAVTLTDRLLAAFAGRLAGLPAATRTLLLVAAAEETGELATVLAAAARLGAGLADLGPAESAGLVTVVERAAGPGLPGGVRRAVAFHHPLVREAVHQRAPLADRLAAHAALAAVLDPAAGPGPYAAEERWAWHLAEAAEGQDERVAAVLERVAVRAHERGGHAAARAGFERAARLSPAPADAVRRLAAAAGSAAQAGELDRAGALAERATADAADPGVRAGLAQVLATVHFARGGFPTAFRLLVEGADAVAGADPGQAARMLFQGFHAAWYLGGEALDDVLVRLEALELPARDPVAPLADYLVPVTALARGRRPAAPLPDLIEVCTRAYERGARIPRDALQVCGASLVAGVDEQTWRAAALLAGEARAQGGFGQLPTVLFYLAEAELFHGRHRDALATADEGLRVAGETAQHHWTGQLNGLLAHLAALAGDEPRCRAAADAAVAFAGGSGGATPEGGAPPGEPWARWALGLLDLGLGRAEAALDRLAALAGGPHAHHVSGTRCVPDLVEAAVRLGRPAAAREPLARFGRWADLTGRPWPRALVLRCRALLAEGPAAEEAYRAALEAHDAQDRPFERARTALLYGEWLRRGRRKAEARPQLRAALEVFERAGAAPWAGRARAELDASGEAAPAAREPGVLAALTPQELQIVRLAADGHSNRDIAARLFLSPRTVGYHLYKAYPKLGVGSRGELPALLG
jgi:DNA-binding CsgD family transcriptional regulator